MKHFTDFILLQTNRVIITILSLNLIVDRRIGLFI